MVFELHPNLQKKSFVCDLDLCTVLFEDNKNYPWIFLVPKKPHVRNMLDLTTKERMQLMVEIETAERVMNDLFHPDQTNVAMIGNVTPQLHVHVICRFKGDPCWPGTVWDTKGEPYQGLDKEKMIARIREALTKAA